MCRRSGFPLSFIKSVLLFMLPLTPAAALRPPAASGRFAFGSSSRDTHCVRHACKHEATRLVLGSEQHGLYAAEFDHLHDSA